MSVATANPMELAFRSWVRSEAQDRDAIKVKRIYIDINDNNLTDGIMFSQIMYWHTPTPEGKSRLSIKRDGHLWLAKRGDEWLEECRIPERTARDALARIEKRGLIEKHTWHFNGVPTTHIRVIQDRFIELVEQFSDPSLIRQKASFDEKRQKQSAENVTCFKTKTTTETTTESPLPPTEPTEQVPEPAESKAATERGREAGEQSVRAGKGKQRKPKAPKPRDIVFDALAESVFRIDLSDNAQVKGHSGRIALLKARLKDMYPTVPDDRMAAKIKEFPAWYHAQPETKTAALPKGENTFPGHFSNFIKSLKTKSTYGDPDPNCSDCSGRGWWIDKSDQYNHQRVICGCRKREGSSHG